MSHQININRIKTLYDALDELKDEVVFVGGATVSLYADRAAPEVRETKDVDILVQIGSLIDFHEIEKKLWKLGFRNDIDSGILCRYLLENLVVDVMPTDETILGFSNKWYEKGFETAVEKIIDDRYKIKIFTPPYFIASKIEAFKGRGKNDGRLSQDFEDIVFILENRSSIWEEMNNSDPYLKKYLVNEFINFKTQPYIEEWVGAHASYYSPPSVYFIMQDMEEFLKKQ
jgi:predicted nucleotidyltransferase